MADFSDQNDVPPFDVNYSCGEVAALLRCSPETVRRWCRRGVLRSFRVAPRGRRFIPASQFLNTTHALRHVLGNDGAQLARYIDSRRGSRRAEA